MAYAITLPQRRRHRINFAAILAALFLVASPCAAQAVPQAKAPEAQLPLDVSKYPGLVPEFGRLAGKLQHDLQYPPARAQSHLLPLLSESTMSYAAFPNYGDVLHQALTIWQQELQESQVLRDWWQHGEIATNGPKIVDALDKVYQLSQYLGEELVVSGALDGRDPRLLVVAELRKPGLKEFLQQMVSQLPVTAKPPVRVLDLQELAAAEDTLRAKQLILLVRSDFVVAALDLATLRNFNARLDAGSREFVSAPFGQRVAQAYEDGVTVLIAADLHKLLDLVPRGTPQTQLAFQRSGFADVRYAVWKHNMVSGQAVTQAELSFIGPRHGVASWLAAPAPLGSLDFVSPKAIAAGAVVLKSPAAIFEDVKELATAFNSNAFATLGQSEQALNLSLKDDLLSLLGGEIALELDNLTPPPAEWKTMLRVSDPVHLQQTLTKLAAIAHFEVKQSDQEGVTYYTVHNPSKQPSAEIGYAFLDGYLVVASSPATLAEGIRLHRAGESLGKSPKLQASLPPGHSSDASALFYQDPSAAAALSLQQLPPEMAQTLSRLASASTPAVVCLYGEESAISEASTSPALDAGMVLVASAIAIPNLLRSRTAANEASAVGILRTVNTAQVTYATTYPDRGFAPDLATLGPLPPGTGAASADHADLLDATLVNASCTAGAWCEKSGYRFRLTAVCLEHQCMEYLVVATPVSADTGTRNFCSTKDGVIRYQAGPPLTAPVTGSECRKWPPLQ